MSKSLLFCSIFCLLFSAMQAQNTFSLANGQELQVKGKKVGTLNKNIHYIYETADTLYFYDYNSGNNTAMEVRIPLQSFNKENVKKYKASIVQSYFKDEVHFQAGPINDSDYELPNTFKKLYHGYTSAPGMDKMHVFVAVAFEDPKQGLAFIKRTQKNIKKFN